MIEEEALPAKRTRIDRRAKTKPASIPSVDSNQPKSLVLEIIVPKNSSSVKPNEEDSVSEIEDVAKSIVTKKMSKNKKAPKASAKKSGKNVRSQKPKASNDTEDTYEIAGKNFPSDGEVEGHDTPEDGATTPKESEIVENALELSHAVAHIAPAAEESVLASVKDHIATSASSASPHPEVMSGGLNSNFQALLPQCSMSTEKINQLYLENKTLLVKDFLAKMVDEQINQLDAAIMEQIEKLTA